MKTCDSSHLLKRLLLELKSSTGGNSFESMDGISSEEEEEELVSSDATMRYSVTQ